jgi:methyl-accepting chemotaxis protein
VNSAVNQMDQVTQQNAAMVEQTTAASHAVAGEAEELTRLMSRFEVQASAPTAPSARTVAALRTSGGRGVSAARKPAPVEDTWEEF